jgi:multicomponent Na+:H+ antiporter subunit C
MILITSLAIGLMFGIGIFQLLRRNVLRSAIGLVIISNAVNLFLLSSGAYWGESPAYVDAAGQRADALPQALVLTAIVIAMAGFAFVMAMIYILAVRYQTTDLDDLSRLRY